MAMPQPVPWTIADLDRLPDDGNRYEVLDGALLVTPAPSNVHQEIAAWLNAALVPSVVAGRLGRVHHPRSVIVVDGSQLEPDLMVRRLARVESWEQAPLPILVVEILSTATRRRDLVDKLAFYMEKGIPEYWIVDRFTRSIHRVRSSGTERVTSTLEWSPAGAVEPLSIDVAEMFAEVCAGGRSGQSSGVVRDG